MLEFVGYFLGRKLGGGYRGLGGYKGSVCLSL